MDRRSFLRLSAAAGGGLAIAAAFPVGAVLAGDRAGAAEMGLYCTIAADGTVVFHLTKHEMGQGVSTALAAIFADELGADWQRVELRYVADGAMPHTLGATGGSGSIASMWLPLRRAAAFVRERLVEAACTEWNVAPAACEAVGSTIRHKPDGRTMGFGAAAALVAAHPCSAPVPATLDELNKLNLPLKPDDQLRLVGKVLGNKRGHAIAHGKLVYGADVKVAGMRYAVLARCPTLRGKLKSFDATAALAVPGVRQVVRVEGHLQTVSRAGRKATDWAIKDSVAVIADNTHAAMRGRAALAVIWDEGPDANVGSASFEQHVAAKMGAPAEVTASAGDPGAARLAERTLEATYVYPYQAHACMEPMNCVAHARPDGCEVWVGTQFPNGIIRSAASLFKVPEAAVKVNVFPSGGGFGRRYYQDVAIEALKVSQAAGGIPVKVIWTRADDLQHGSFHPYARSQYRASLAGNRIVDWYHKEARAYFGDGTAGELPWMAYDIAHVHTDFMGSLHDDSPIQGGAWRSVIANHWAFGQECFLDEVAHALREDPYRLRRRLLQGGREVKGVAHSSPERGVSSARLLAVLELAARKAGWDQPVSRKAAGKTRHGRGIAVYPYIHGNSYCAQVVEVSVTGTEIRVERVVVAVDCGKVIDPDGVKKQMEGGVVWGLSAALHGGLMLENGAIRNSNFHDNPVLRMRECPAIEVHFIDNPGPQPCGTGELSTPPVVPALLNAIFAATGRRIRRLPVTPADLA